MCLINTLSIELIFDFDHSNTCIVSIRESCVLVKGCSVFRVICTIHFHNNVPLCFFPAIYFIPPFCLVV